MTQRTISPDVALAALQASCALPAACGLRMCKECLWNHWLQSHQCHWCDSLLLDGEGHVDEFGHHFCGEAKDSPCAWLHREAVARRYM